MISGFTILARPLTAHELASFSVISSAGPLDVLFRDHDVELVRDREHGVVTVLVPERTPKGRRVMRPLRSYPA